MFELSAEEDRENGYKTFVDKQIEWGMLDPNVSSELTAAGAWTGTSGATVLALEDGADDRWTAQSLQPAQSGGESSSWWQAKTTWGTSSWGASSSWWASTDEGAAWQSSQPAAAAWAAQRAPALRQPQMASDPREKGPDWVVRRIWADGSDRQWWQW